MSTHTSPVAFHLGLEFRDIDGTMFRSYQLLNDHGYAVATADFNGQLLERFIVAHIIAPAEADEFLTKAKWLNLVASKHEPLPNPA
jgi:hypothetical protein